MMDKALEQLRDLMEHEDIHPDLIPYVRSDSLLPMVHHPLVIEIGLSFPKLINQRYLHKKKLVDDAFSAGEWNTYIVHHERPYRIEALMRGMENGLMDFPQTFWSMVNYVWTDSENIYRYLEDWRFIWESDVPDRLSMMTTEERAFYNDLPERVTVYRGTAYEDSLNGMSWTMNRKRAEWFAQRFDREGGTPMIATAEVTKADILAYLNNRNEEEIVILDADIVQVDEL